MRIKRILLKISGESLGQDGSGVTPDVVAKVAGTSIAMIDRHYGHLRQEHARDALAKLAL